MRMTKGQILVLLTAVVAVTGLPMPETLDSELVHVQLMNELDDHRAKRDVTQSHMPDVIVTQFRYSGDDIILRLRRVNDIPMILVGETGSTGYMGTPQDLGAVYADPSRSGAFIVKRPADDNGGFLFDGSLQHQGKHLLLTPAHRSRRSARMMNPHVASIKVERISFGEDAMIKNPDENQQNTNVANSQNPVRGKRQADPVVHTIEAAMIVDNKDYQKWQARYPAEEVDGQLQLFYTLTAQTVDKIFSSINENDSSVKVRFVATQLYVLKEPTFSFTDAFAQSGIVDGEVVLRELQDWIPTQTAFGLDQNADIYMLFTGYDVARGGSTAVVGVAPLGAVCKGTSSAAVIEDGMMASTAQVASHELGHALNAMHDVTAECPPSARNIMSPVFQASPTFADPGNYYDFSTCSVQEITDYLDSVTCTRPEATTFSADSDPVASSLVTDVDEQCRFLTNYPNGGLCPFMQEVSCTGMLCAVPSDDPAFTRCSIVLPFDGTPCGVDKVCDQGACIEKLPASTGGDQAVTSETTTPAGSESTTQVAAETTTQVAAETTTQAAAETTITQAAAETTATQAAAETTTTQAAAETATTQAFSETITQAAAETTTTQVATETTAIQAVPETTTTTQAAAETTTTQAAAETTATQAAVETTITQAAAETTTTQAVAETSTQAAAETTTSQPAAETTTTQAAAETATTQAAAETTTTEAAAETSITQSAIRTTTTQAVAETTTTRAAETTTTQAAIETTTIQAAAETTATQVAAETTTTQVVAETTTTQAAVETTTTEAAAETTTTQAAAETTATQAVAETTTAQAAAETTTTQAAAETTTNQAAVETTTTEAAAETTTTQAAAETTATQAAPETTTTQAAAETTTQAAAETTATQAAAETTTTQAAAESSAQTTAETTTTASAETTTAAISETSTQATTETPGNNIPPGPDTSTNIALTASETITSAAAETTTTAAAETTTAAAAETTTPQAAASANAGVQNSMARSGAGRPRTAWQRFLDGFHCFGLLLRNRLSGSRCAGFSLLAWIA